jgi:hypothetical protein
VVPTSANGQLAFGHYIWREEANVFVPGEISVLTLRGTQIAGITIFRDPGGTGTLRATGRDRAVTSCEPRTEVLELVVFSVKPGEREALLEGREAAMTAPAERGRPELGGTHRRGSRSPPRDRPPPVRCRPVKGRAEAVI